MWGRSGRLQGIGETAGPSPQYSMRFRKAQTQAVAAAGDPR